MTQPAETITDPPVGAKTFSIRVLGVGGAGCNALAHLAREPLRGVHFSVLNTDAATLRRNPVETKLNLGLKSMRGLGAGGDPDRGRVAAEEDAAEIGELCRGADVIFLVAGLGGGTGTGAGPVVARLAKETGALVLAFAILPFDCEGGRRQRQANLGLAELKAVADGVIILPNEKVKKLADEHSSLLEVFGLANELVAQGLRSLWRLLDQPGLINVDFADLCAVTRGAHAESVLAVAEAKGENRSREVVEKLLAHPLLEGGQVLSDAGSVLVTFNSGPSLSMIEIERVLDQVRRHAEHAHLILGTSLDEAMGDALAVTLLASRRPGGPGDNGARGSEEAGSASHDENSEFARHFVDTTTASRASRSCVPPPPETTPQATEHLLRQQPGPRRKNHSRWRQGQLALEIVSKGRFDKSEPTILHGQDLDLPTYIRRGVSLN